MEVYLAACTHFKRHAHATLTLASGGMARSKESEIQAAICDYLAYKGYLFSRTNNAPIYDRTNGAFRALPKYTRRGWPDICLIAKGQFIGIEVKTEAGRLSAEQMSLRDDILGNGGQYIVARSIDELQEAGL
jgi:hypothetical protein